MKRTAKNGPGRREQGASLPYNTYKVSFFEGLVEVEFLRLAGD
jgi:hypothetical protein